MREWYHQDRRGRLDDQHFSSCGSSSALSFSRSRFALFARVVVKIFEISFHMAAMLDEVGTHLRVLSTSCVRARAWHEWPNQLHYAVVH
jgi:hypothetical protein